MQLSIEQEAAIDMIETAKGAVRLLGSPGVGKSTVVNNLRDHFIPVAPTNKAASIIGGTTLHKLLKLALVKRRDKFFTIVTKDTKLIKARVVIDESSCISKQMLGIILQYVKYPVFVGDEAQLSPVGEDGIPFMGLDIPTQTLETLHRHSGEVAEVAAMQRKCILKNIGDFSVPKSWETPNLDGDVVIAWRNKTVDVYNNLIQYKRYGTLDWCVGQSVRIGTHYKGLTAESEFSIKAVRRCGRFWSITLSNGEIVPVLHDDCKSEHAEALEECRLKEDWRKFHSLKETYCDLRPSYAITAHKAQGSTYKNVVVDYKDIFANAKKSEAMRAAYVATTRASTSVGSLI